MNRALCFVLLSAPLVAFPGSMQAAQSAHGIQTFSAALTATPPTTPPPDTTPPAPPAPPAPPTTAKPSSTTAPPPSSAGAGAADKPRPRTIDDLLGTKPDRAGEAAQGDGPPVSAGHDQVPPDPDGRPTSAADDPSALRRALTEQEAASAFQQAIEQMARSAALLDQRTDPGLETQRVQEDVLAKLDLLLKQPPRRGQSSSSPRRQQQQQQQQQNVPDQQQSQQQQQQQQEQTGSDPSAAADPSVPLRQDALLEQALESAGAEWGDLPERVRDMIRQGLRERPSSLYLRLTEEYYRRLAEDSR